MPEVKKKVSVRKLVLDYFLITIGVLMYTFSWQAFVVPTGISGGGLVGFCTVLNYATGIPIPVFFGTINAALLIIGTIVLGRGFGFKTIYSIILSTIFFAIMPGMEWIYNVGLNTIPPDSPQAALRYLVNPIIGGFLCAAGIALIFKRNGSTGGTDILALIINKYKDISPGKVFMYSDFCIVASIMLLPDKHLSDVIFGYIFTIAFSYMVDLILTGSEQSVQVIIFSQKYQEVADNLMYEHNRGVTALDSVGWHSKQEGKVLIVVARKYQLKDITQAVKGVDPKAFISVSNVSAVYGLGFAEIKGRAGKSTESRLKRLLKWIDS
ncbi:MAG: YitT family protein [Bacteroidales bacterium]|nr:YitT family protein [Bacteroidales bacterium]